MHRVQSAVLVKNPMKSWSFVSGVCLESLPCQHYVRVVKDNGTVKSTTMDARWICDNWALRTGELYGLSFEHFKRLRDRFARKAEAKE